MGFFILADMYVAIADFLFIPFFFGFVVWSAFYVISKRDSIAGYDVEKTDNFVIRAVIFLGICHLLFSVINAVIYGFDAGRAFGKYWFGFWIYPITYIGLTQLLWFKKIRKEKTFRLVMAGWFFLVIQFEKLIIIATSIYRDFSAAGYWLTHVGFFLLNMIISFSIFVTLLIMGLEIKTWTRKRKE